MTTAPGRVATLPAGGRGADALVRRIGELAGVRRAGELTATPEHRLLPVAEPLRPLLPGLRRGGSVVVTGSRYLLLAVMAPVTWAGGWTAVVGMPELGLLAAAQAGVALERTALVPDPGPHWPAVTAALLDGLDLVVVAPNGPVNDRVAGQLAARARRSGAVLVAYGPWPGADLTLSASPGRWEGLARGHGRLRARELTVTAYGRGAAARPRQVRVLLPDPAGRPAPAPVTDRRPVLTVVEGEAA